MTKRMEENLDDIGENYLDFCRELYFGGSKTRGNPPFGSRQMILSDVFQYIITSRGYYLATENDDYRKKFIKIVMYLVNQWLIMDSFGATEAFKLRRELMNILRQEIGDDDFFEMSERYHIDRFEDALEYKNDLIPNPPNPNPPVKRILNSYDSLFPKIRSGPMRFSIFIFNSEKTGFCSFSFNTTKTCK